MKHPIHMAFRWQRMLEQDEKLTMRTIARREFFLIALPCNKYPA